MTPRPLIDCVLCAVTASDGWGEAGRGRARQADRQAGRQPWLFFVCFIFVFFSVHFFLVIVISGLSPLLHCVQQRQQQQPLRREQLGEKCKKLSAVRKKKEKKKNRKSERVRTERVREDEIYINIYKVDNQIPHN